MSNVRHTSEVFPLPFAVDAEISFKKIFSARKIGEWPAAKHVAHTLNQVDNLAAALDEVLEMLELEGRHNDREYILAKAALDRYKQGG